jgi:hypothetical protein
MRKSPPAKAEQEVKSLHEMVALVQIKIRVPEDKKLTVGNVSTAVHQMGIPKKVTEAIIHALDEQKTEQYCGPANARGNGRKRYRRGGTKKRCPKTVAGELNLKLHQVIDTHANRVFRPVEDVIEFDGRKVYQEDISMISVELATKMSYRDAVTEGKLFTKMPSPSTVNRRAIQYGKKARENNHQQIKGARVKTVFPDGTKCHSQEKTTKNEVNVSLGLDEEGNKVLLDVAVDRPWHETAKTLDEADALDKKAVITGDGEREMINALVTGEREHQMDFLHIIRGTGFRLWEDAELSLKDRKAIVKELEATLYPLKNSVEKHLKDGDMDALKNRIDSTVDTLKNLAGRLKRLGCAKAAEFIRRVSNTAVTFARLAVEGRTVPWNSNIIERLMGEISKRCKHKWMRWTSKGLEAILNIILLRYTSEEKYQRLKAEITKADNLKFIYAEAKIVSAGGANFSQR